MTLSQNFFTLMQRIRECEKKYHKPENSVHLLAASKMQSAESMRNLYQLGQIAFGENKVQEALEKMQLLADLNIEWHFIGSIQRNKTRKIAEHFAWVHSVADALIAKRLNDQRPSHLPPLNVCIEVNLDQENTKSGVAIKEAFALAAFCAAQNHLKLRGLMAIPAFKQTFEEQANTFHILKSLRDDLNAQGMNLDILSMGMTQDFEAAISQDANIVRIGSALFGAR